MIRLKFYFVLLSLLTLGTGCGPNQDNSIISKPSFRQLTARQTGIEFVNTIEETAEKNVLNYEYFYNGGGVAVGDLNGDGLPDLYFTGNMVPNQLYLNQGGMKFREISQQSGVQGRANSWTTGVTLVDINADGLLDIYLCYSGDVPEDQRRNELYLNQGNQNGIPIFAEAASEFGLDLPTHTTQALFVDYDRDGDLDVYLLNHSIEDFQNFDATFVKNQRDSVAGDRLLQNENGKFVDVSEAAGIKGTPLGFGLGIVATDVNNDGWVDLYVSNDYIEEDYLYINQKDGTFRDQLKDQIGHISHFSMGANVADINNDGWMDILSLDMLPEDNRRQKLLYGPDTYEKYQYMLRNGFYHQIMRNMLQVNNGDGTFSELGQLAGISNTDWSWSPVFADFDNDGWQDLFVTNGYLRDYTNRDFVSYYANQRIKDQRGETSDALMDIIAQMPSTQTANYIFHNQSDLTFSDKSKAWGFNDKILSNGAVAADLDQDGDEDLIVNNLNAPASIYENQVAKGHFLKVSIKGKTQNPNAIGSKVLLKSQGQWQTQEFIPTRGFQSAVHLPLNFGLGTANKVDSLIVRWPDGQFSIRTQVEVDQMIEIDPSDSQPQSPLDKPGPTLFSAQSLPLAYTHQENPDIDFKQQSLLTYALSYQGPSALSADFNGDGQKDLFIGGAKMQPAQLFLQTTNGGWQAKEQTAFQQDLISEDVTALAFDADQDGDLDIYAGSGGYHYLAEDLALQDRLYLNDGAGNFAKAKNALPLMRTSTGSVTGVDFDQDGDTDLFVGGRLVPGQYPTTPRSYLLKNKGDGTFEEVTEREASKLLQPGLITSSLAQDLNGDGRVDLLLAGEWMPLTAVLNLESGWQINPNLFGPATNGWWQELHAADLDDDGDLDIIAGNLGKNTNLKVSQEEPAELYIGDFDNNGTIDPLLTHYIKGASYPFNSRDNLFGQLPALKKNFTTYEAYSDATIKDILPPEQLSQAKKLQVNQGATVWLENQGNGKWSVNEFPVAAQMAPVFAIHTKDFNGDGRLDVLLAGNLTDTRSTMGPWDANYGQVFLNRGDHFEYLPQHQSGLKIIGDIRAIQEPVPGVFIFIRNNQAPLYYQQASALVN